MGIASIAGVSVEFHSAVRVARYADASFVHDAERTAGRGDLAIALGLELRGSQRERRRIRIVTEPMLDPALFVGGGGSIFRCTCTAPRRNSDEEGEKERTGRR
jgi:hypothetical protein